MQIKFKSDSIKINGIAAKGGFTLIEVSIVLIIIAILTAGIIIGSSMIENARIQSVINDISKFKTATIAFIEKYDAYPGDMPNATSYWPTCDDTGEAAPLSTCNGNGDRQIDRSSKREDYWVWYHLSLAGMIEAGLKGGGLLPGTNSPSSKYGKVTGYRFFYNETGTVGSGLVRYGHAIRLGKDCTVSCGIRNGVISPLDAIQIDSRTDDGLANSGNMVSTNSKDLGTCISGGGGNFSYQTNKQTSCLIWFFMDGILP